ncbi:MAG: hypothetical protein ACRCX7_06390 [Cetobacterium sp.]|uniref:hypothetical protein n=2 Tax=Cetobacterium sp. TaxID=2071632 RepID=UPI003EE55B07
MEKEYSKKVSKINDQIYTKGGIDTVGLTCKTDIDIEEIKILNGVLEKYTYLIGIEEILVTIKASNILNGGIELTNLSETMEIIKDIELNFNLVFETLSRVDFSVDLLGTVKENKKKFILFLECLDLKRKGMGMYETKKPVRQNKKTGNLKISTNRVQTTIYDCIDKRRLANTRIENRIVNIRTKEVIKKRIQLEMKKYIKELNKLEELVPLVEDFYINFLIEQYRVTKGKHFNTFTGFIEWADFENLILTERVLKDVLKASGLKISFKEFVRKFKKVRPNTLNYSGKTEVKKLSLLIKKELKKVM